MDTPHVGNLLRAVIPGPVKKRLKRVFGIPQTRLHSDWKVLSCIGPVYRPHVVLDVGARHGWFFHCWQDWCPDAQVHAFEPVQEAFDTAMRLYGSHPLVKINQAGVGCSEGSLDIKIFEKSGASNSFLSLRKETWEEVQFETGSVTERAVPVTTIDAYCGRESLPDVYLLKIDVQGYELKVLEGAEATLPRIDHIFVETGIVPFYEGAPRFTDIYEFLSQRGFHLMAMQAWHRGNHKLMETDMLFRRDDLLLPIDDRVGKVMERLG